ncbi:MAG TPA: SPOR domain-containing protein [Alphaproteobacteria bacterium]|nr:SPOR domain-containing protein [Alphaproteobacteria bacterium]
MTNPPPPELFPQRPVRSDFGARPYRKRRLITMVVLIAVIGLGLYLKYGRKPEAPGPIPTIAAAGPLKQKPQEPGGVAIPNQNVLAYQQIDNSGKDKPAVDHLAPPPETPKPVTPGAAPAPPPATPSSPLARIETLQPPPLPKLATTAVQPNHPAAMAEDNKPAAPASVPAVAMPAPNPVPAPSVIVTPSSPMTEPAPAAAVPEPAPAHAAPAVEEKPAAETESKPAAKTEKKKAAVVSGHYRVQLASMPDESGARSAVHKLQHEYAGALGKARLHLVRADLGARGIYYRVRSSPMSKDEARHVCAMVKRHGGGCILVKP